MFWLCAFFGFVLKNKKMYQADTLDWTGGKNGGEGGPLSLSFWGCTRNLEVREGLP